MSLAQKIRVREMIYDARFFRLRWNECRTELRNVQVLNDSGHDRRMGMRRTVVSVAQVGVRVDL